MRESSEQQEVGFSSIGANTIINVAATISSVENTWVLRTISGVASLARDEWVRAEEQDRPHLLSCASVSDLPISHF